MGCKFGGLMSKSAVFISIREKSTRLPKKSLRQIEGRTVCEWLIARTRLASAPDLVVLTTSIDPRDAVLCDIATRCGVKHFQGSEDDKLERYLQAAREFQVDLAVIVDGDDLFVSEEHIDAAIAKFRETGADYVSQQGLPLGAASFGVRVAALDEVCRLKAESDTEVWGGYFTKSNRFNVRMLQVDDPILRRPDVRMTLDYPEDLAFFEKVLGALGKGGAVPTFREIMQYIHAHPEVIDINRGAQAKYEQNLLKSAPVRMKEGRK
jgi:spore coat polysaccharide biosynthesis protein SpsF